MELVDYGAEMGMVHSTDLDDGDHLRHIGDVMRSHFFVPAGQMINFEQDRDVKGMVCAESQPIPLSRPDYRLVIELRSTKTTEGTALIARGFYYRGNKRYAKRTFLLFVNRDANMVIN